MDCHNGPLPRLSGDALHLHNATRHLWDVLAKEAPNLVVVV
jgi:hypothetical protein